MHPVMPYGHAYTTSPMVSYGSDLSQGGSRQPAPCFSVAPGHTRSTSAFSPGPVSFMTRPAASYIDGVVSTPTQDVVWYPDSGATHHITNNHSNLQSDVVYTDDSPKVTGTGSFPLVLVNDQVEKVAKSGCVGGSTQDVFNCHGPPLVDKVNATYGSGPVPAFSDTQRLISDQFSEESGSPVGSGSAEQQEQPNKETDGNEFSLGCSTHLNPAVQLNKAADGFDLGSMGCINSGMGSDVGCSSKNVDKGIDSDVRISQGFASDVPQSDLGISLSSVRLGNVDLCKKTPSPVKNESLMSRP
ncbi:hypothetical protein V6N12_027324 [Hibiscus sabdariffa]|uniref:Uncharacterized protein n=1 Tax=Hibiscus sabdariffa TaxID=183260 RepID=A0ABR2DUE2_9ROSI